MASVPGQTAEDGSSVWTFASKLENQTLLLNPDFGPATPRSLRPLEEGASGWKISMPPHLYVCISLFQIIK